MKIGGSNPPVNTNIMLDINRVKFLDVIDKLPPDIQYAYEDHKFGVREYFCPNCEQSQFKGYDPFEHWAGDCEGKSYFTCSRKLSSKEQLLRWLNNG